MGIFQKLGRLTGETVGREVGRSEYDSKSFIGKVMTLRTREGYADETAEEYGEVGETIGSGVGVAMGDPEEMIDLLDEFSDED